MPKHNLPSCCRPIKKPAKSGFLTGLSYGIIPHTFCILFIILSVFGATTATLIFKPLMLNRNFFYYLIFLSFVFSAISAFFYLNRNACLSTKGIKKNLKYLIIMFSTTIGINLLLFLVIFPSAANFSRKDFSTGSQNNQESLMTISVDVPCSGHATLISSELKTLSGISQVRFRLPNLFDINYDPKLTTPGQILNLSVFKTYRATKIS